MQESRFLGLAFAGALLAGIFGLSYHTTGLSAPDLRSQLSEHRTTILPSSNPSMIEDQLRARSIAQVYQNLPNDQAFLKRRYNELPPFTPRNDPHLSARDVANFIKVCDNYKKEMRAFKRSVIGENPKMFSVFAMVGMIGSYWENIKYRSLLTAGIKEEEFNWETKRIMETGLFAVEYNLSQNPSPEEKEKLIKIRDQMFILTGVTDVLEDGTREPHPERVPDLLARVPRKNLELFLDNYKNIYWYDINFERSKIEFDRAAIMSAAMRNPE